MDENEEFILEDDAPGPKKSFWAHLNDLRTALLRSAIAIGIALVLCLLLSEKLISLLEYPLTRMDMFEAAQPTVSFQIGDTKLGPYTVTREQFAGLPPGEAPQVVGVRLYVEQHNSKAMKTYLSLGMTDAGYAVMERMFGKPC